MTRSHHTDLAERYFLEDLPGATQLGARLNGILLRIDAGEQVATLQRQFLATTGLHALVTLTDGKATLGVQGGDKTSHWNASEVLSVAE